MYFKRSVTRDLDSRTPGLGRVDRRLGLVGLRSAQSRLAGHHLQQLLVVEGEDDVEVVEERFRLRTRDAERDRGATDATDGRRLVG